MHLALIKKCTLELMILMPKMNTYLPKHILKSIRADYIYLKIDKKTKGQTPENGFVLIDN